MTRGGTRGTAGIATRVLCVLPRGNRIAGCDSATPWQLSGAKGAALGVDKSLSVLGGGSLAVAARQAGLCTLQHRFPEACDLSCCSGISFFYRYTCELFAHTGKRGRNVGVRLRSGSRGFFEYMPIFPPFPEKSEDRYEWNLFQAAKSSLRAEGAPDLARVTDLEIIFGPEEPADFAFHLDAVIGET